MPARINGQAMPSQTGLTGGGSVVVRAGQFAKQNRYQRSGDEVPDNAVWTLDDLNGCDIKYDKLRKD